ncbi:MAG: adenosylmethionine--8-amino-7-oxononanoate transaminase [Chthoniobacterales bacterium]
MSSWDTADLAAADKKYLWHPFTPMAEWCAPGNEPIVLVGGEGALLWDSRGREYIDGNSSIWTNIHGHNHPYINAAIKRQLERVAHTSFLGFTNPAAIELARALVRLFPAGTLSRVFYSDDGSTGVEVALRIVAQYWHIRSQNRRTFIAFRHGYHGDTVGAASLGAAAMFGTTLMHGVPVRQVESLPALQDLPSSQANQTAAVVIEPMVQGAAGMRLWPQDTLAGVRRWCDKSGALLIADEVMTGFGRTGRMFASEHDKVYPDLMILGKALTGGYLPLAITLVTEQIFSVFLGDVEDERTLFYGHSFTGNALACSAARASLDLFEQEQTLSNLGAKISLLSEGLGRLQQNPSIRETRQCGFIAGIELRAEAFTGRLRESKRLGAEVCLAARGRGLLTRPIGNTIVLMPPFCTTDVQLNHALGAIRDSIEEVRHAAA